MSKKNWKYWIDRERDAIQTRISDTKKMEKEIASLFDKMEKEIDKEINAMYGKYANENGLSFEELQRVLSKMDVEKFAKKAKEYVKNKDFSDKANEELKLYNLRMRVSRLELLKIQMDLILTEYYDQVESLMWDKFYDERRKEAERQAGILGGIGLLSKKDVEEIVNGSFKVGDFSDNIWEDKERLYKALDEMVSKAIFWGENANQRAKQLAGICGSSKAEALRILRTEIANVQIHQQKSGYIERKVEYYQIVVEPARNKPCSLCQSIGESGEKIDDAVVYRVSEMTPGVNAPVFHPNCRCSTVPYMPDFFN